MKTQQLSLYAAEHSTDPGPAVENVQDYLDELRETWWWPRRIHRVFVTFDPKIPFNGLGRFIRADDAGEVIFSNRTPYTRTVLHELSHVFSQALYGSRAHDPWFARTHAEVTYLVRGSTAYQNLTRAYTAVGIDFDAKGVVDSQAIRA